MKLAALVLAWILALPSASAHAKPPARITCKPCGDLVEAALGQARIIVLGKVVTPLDPPPAAGQPGEGVLEVQVLKWMRGKPAQKAPTRGLTRLKVALGWDGACRSAPEPLKKGQKLVLFLEDEGHVLPHPCAASHVPTTGPEYADLKRRLTKDGRVD